MTRLHHTRLDQIGAQIERDMGKDALGNRRFAFGTTYRFKVAHASLRRVSGNTSFFADWARKMEKRHGISIGFDLLAGDEVFMTVKWALRKVPA